MIYALAPRSALQPASWLQLVLHQP